MGVMIPMKRERMLTIRVTDDEHARLLERCEGKQLAVWMRRDQRKITQGQCQRFVNTDVGVPQGSQQHPAMQIRIRAPSTSLRPHSSTTTTTTEIRLLTKPERKLSWLLPPLSNN